VSICHQNAEREVIVDYKNAQDNVRSCHGFHQNGFNFK